MTGILIALGFVASIVLLVWTWNRLLNPPKDADR